MRAITGHNGKNKLIGTTAVEKIDGKGGKDYLWGKGGSDILTGGASKDAFMFDTKLGSDNVDTVTDFKPPDDRICLNDSVFTKLGSTGTLAASKFVIGKKALDSTDRVIYNSKTGDLSYDADGSGSGAAIKFAKLDAHLKMTAADFVVI